MPRITPWRVVGLIVLTLALLVASWWLQVTRDLDPAPHEAVLDELAIPDSWEFVHTNVVQDILMGSRVDRYYIVDADPDDTLGPVTEMVEAAGFTVDVRRASRDWCDNRPLGATPEITCPTKLIPACNTNGPTGPMTCHLTATRAEDRLSIVVRDRGERTTYYAGSEQHFVGEPDRIVIRVTIDY